MNPKPLHPEVIKTVLKAARFNKADGPSELETLMLKAKQITLDVRKIVREVQDAPGYSDPKSLLQLTQKCYLDKFNKFSKDELLMLITIIHTDIASEQIL